MLYIIRHADALDAPEDAERMLSPRGRQQVDLLAKFLRKSGEFQPAEFWHSPLIRAKETAELLAEGVRSKARVMEVSGLRPENDPATIAGRLSGHDRSIAVVGHDPHLTGLATLLVTGSPEPSAFIMRKGAALALGPGRHAGAGGWIVVWHVAPELLVG